MKRCLWMTGGRVVALSCATAVLGLASAAAYVASSAEEGTLRVTSSGVPSAEVDVFLLVNQGKTAMGATSPAGELPFDPALLTGKVRVEVVVRDCSGRREVYLVAGSEDDACREAERLAEREEDCRCDPAGVIWWGSRLGVDVAELTASGGAAPLTQNGLFWGGLAGAGGAAVAIGSGGDDATSSTPAGSISTTTTSAPPTTTTSTTAVQLSGPYDVQIVSVTDPDRHRQHTGDPPPWIQIQAANGGFRATGNPPWVRVDGTIDGSGRFRAEGRGNVAGFPDTLVVFEGDIQMMAPYRLNGLYRMGTGGELPGGRPIEFRLQGQKR